MEKMEADDLEGRYLVASEVRNNLVAAAQNINGAQRYLANVTFPYCTPDEVETLNKVCLLQDVSLNVSDETRV